MQYERNRRMVEQLVKQGIVKTEAVKKAILAVPRELFVWEGYESLAYDDQPLLLGDTGQTISAPHMVAIMLEELEVKKGQKVLEVGSGSGYNAACLSYLVGEDGKVISVEINEELIKFARKNIQRLGLKNIDIIQGDGSLGYPPCSNEEIYDRIIVTAAAKSLPNFLRLQLKKGGIMLIPLGDTYMQVLTKFTKDMQGRLKTKNICDVVFVPLVGQSG